ncbi:MAG: NUDIX hydrolase [Candidatus Levybacteria bacterium]|nr:NUDIX hydrolase [Candidatus Levybacteria bacterium]MBP9814729.1 NUDIX hydrolase [Candidatus Levybacteria bacterium]
MSQKLPLDEFLKTFEKVPRVAISLLIIDQDRRVLLTKRSINPGKNTWHLPGSFILKGERVKDCIARILKVELGFEGSFRFRVENVFEDLEKDPRGHIIDMIYRVEGDIIPHVTDETEEVVYFSIMPDNIGFNHREVLQVLGYK